MEERWKLWLDWEMKEFSELFQQFNKRLMKKVPLWMGVSIFGMVALGFLVGYDAAYVFRVHFLIGLGLALVILLCFWLQTRLVSMKKVHPAYEQAFGKLSGEEKAAFLRQMELKTYGKLNFLNGTTDKYPCRLLVGPEYWLYFRDLSCRIVKAEEIQSLTGREEKTRVGYTLGNTRVSQKLTVAVSLVIEYRAESGKGQENLLLENGGQLEQAVELIRRYCPRCAELFF